MNPNDKYCLMIDGKKVCIRGSDEDNSVLEASEKYLVDRLETLNSKEPFRMVKKCKIQGQECFKRNTKNAGVFVILMMIASILLNFLHELVHYSFLVIGGIMDASFTFSAAMGLTEGSLPALTDPTIPWFWWFMELMGPLLLVNFPAVVISMVIVRHSDGNPPYIERTTKQTSRWLSKNFLKAVAYASAFTVLTNTIFSPFYKIAYGFLGDSAVKSDFEWAWQASLGIAEPFGMMMRSLLIIAVSGMISITFLFLLLYNRRDMGR